MLRNPKTSRVVPTCLWMVLLAFSGCGGDDIPTVKNRSFGGPVRPGTPSIEAREKVQRGATDAKGSAKVADSKTQIELPPLTDESFIEIPEQRDPFRSFIDALSLSKLKQNLQTQRNVILPEYDINSLRVVAIVTGVGNPRAMVVDSKGEGHIIRRGDYVGRGEIVERPDTEGGDIQINWRVERIRGEGVEEERGVYFKRDDPTAPKNALVTKFMPLYPMKD